LSRNFIPRKARRHFGQKLIHALFRFFVGYLRASGLVELDAGGLSALRKSEGLIVAANHPCLLDAVLVVSHCRNGLPDEAESGGHVAFSGTARLAGISIINPVWAS